MFRLRERYYSESRVHFSGDWCDAVQRPRGTAKPSTEVVGAAGSTLIVQYTKRERKGTSTLLTRNTTAASARFDNEGW